MVIYQELSTTFHMIFVILSVIVGALFKIHHDVGELKGKIGGVVDRVNMLENTINHFIILSSLKREDREKEINSK